MSSGTNTRVKLFLKDLTESDREIQIPAPDEYEAAGSVSARDREGEGLIQKEKQRQKTREREREKERNEKASFSVRDQLDLPFSFPLCFNLSTVFISETIT